MKKRIILFLFFFLLGNSVYAISPDDLIINEIMYHPPDTLGTDSEFEFVELYNATNYTLNLEGIEIKDNISTFIIPSNILISSHNYIVICRDTTSIRNHYGSDILLIGNGTF